MSSTPHFNDINAKNIITFRLTKGIWDVFISIPLEIQIKHKK